MSIIGAHMLFYSSHPEALRKTLREAFGFKSVDAGGGWLIFALPPAELGVHPSEGSEHKAGGQHQVSFMCDDIRATISNLRSKGVQVDGKPQKTGFGITATMTLPGDVRVMLYEPRHKMAIKPRKAR